MMVLTLLVNQIGKLIYILTLAACRSFSILSSLEGFDVVLISFYLSIFRISLVVKYDNDVLSIKIKTEKNKMNKNSEQYLN